MFLSCLLFVAASHLFSWAFLRRRAEDNRSSTVWFAMHAIVNGAIAATSTESLRRVLAGEPNIALAHPPMHNYTPLALALILHTYHCIFFHLTRDDLFHHTLFALVMGIPSVLYANDAVNAMLFAVSGVPGGIIYATIVARRLGWTTVSEPRVSALVNVTLRLPLVIWINASYLAAPSAPPRAAVLFQTFLSSANAIGYSMQAVHRVRRGMRKNKTSPL